MAKKRVKSIFEDYDVLWKFARGTAKWAYLLEPDDYGNWSLNLYGPEVEEMEEELQAYLDEAVEFAKEQGKDVQAVAPIYNKDNEGNTFMKVKKKQYDEDTPRPKIFNVTGEDVTDTWSEPIGGGSTVRVKMLIKPYYMPTTKTVGLSKKLIAVQIIKNKSFTTNGGFTDESSNDNPPFEVEESEEY